MPQTGHFILHSNVLPEVTAGRYELVSDQTGVPFDVDPEHTHVTVSAPRYTMPTDQILSTFPPANAEGSFGDRLPQIVLKRRTLPWERNPAGAIDPSTTPWLALVVAAEGEVQLSSAAPVADCVTPGTTLLDPADRDVEQGLYLAATETVVRKLFPTVDDLSLLVHVREVDVNDTELANGDDDGWLAVVLANRLPVADEATGGAVRYMAYLVNVEGQLAALPKPSPAVDHFVFELAQDWRVLATVDPASGADLRVMGGMDLTGVALPGPASLAGGPAAAMAGGATFGAPRAGAALDGAQVMTERAVGGQWAAATEKVTAAARDPDAKRLVRDAMAGGFRLPIERYAREKVLRFPVLAHWSFTTRGAQTFETLMRDLDVGLLGTVEPETAPVAPVGADAPAPAARPAPEVVQTGHLGLGHRTRRGDATRAWYRGPLVPFPTVRDPGGEQAPLAHAADQLRRVVPDGREDLSLAAAFEIGRLLGLSQLSVVSALLRFRGEQFGAARVRELVAATVDFELPPFDRSRVDLGRFVAVRFVDELARAPERMIGPRRPVADPGRAIRVSGDLDQVVAAGLGVDYDAVRKMAERVGVVDAIAMSRVPVASPEGSPLDKNGVAALRSALGATLTRVAEVAAPPKVVGPVRRGAAAQPGPDPLDALIARAEQAADDEEE